MHGGEEERESKPNKKDTNGRETEQIVKMACVPRDGTRCANSYHGKPRRGAFGF